ncbi:helix-turn-helix transcriptional regulator [Psychromarinibacter sp. C21-152]|uniref:Helix-turn-helix transcriptional regulator n=1 Tax=Psychromarinibacter sediminicola TaxID=3033385 RepID=A0AAE3T845_9RHOB|nr:helix-turn-helix transcriptional regulator [Psychromarinibacter sediminicola]MDF0600368.1 helix-turn-helix transcriptional regulator [Psychromarinibacter sediminicola]
MDDNGAAATGGWYSNDAATFGDRLVAAREALGLSQADLARRIGVKLKTMNSWENDLSEPRANKLSMLAGVLNVSLVWLLNGEGEGLAEPEADPIPEEYGALLTELRQLRASLSRTAERLGSVEKRLQRAIREQG